MKLLKMEELEDFQEVHLDEIGNVYRYQGEIIRIINKKAERYVRQLFGCGLIEELIEKKLFVETIISEYCLQDNQMVLIHKTIFPQTVSTQWSFCMQKDAALLVLQMNQVCWKYGYELKDCHQFNILFDGCKPVYVDFGSIVKRKDKEKWIARDEFLKCFYYPLKLWKMGYSNLVAALLRNWKYQNLDEMRRMYYANLPKAFLEKISQANALVNKNPTSEIEYLIKKIDALNYHEGTIWGDYQDVYWERGNKRFEYEIEWIKSREDIYSVIEIGANQGNFSCMLLKGTQVKQVIASDYDMEAVDKMYQRVKQIKKLSDQLTPVLLDFASDSLLCLHKFISDLVVANALMHHLILTQGLAITAIVGRLSALTNKYVIVEFMPLGVAGIKSRLPLWYTLEWFLENLEKEFEILKVNKLEKNRIVIIGEKHA